MIKVIFDYKEQDKDLVDSIKNYIQSEVDRISKWLDYDEDNIITIKLLNKKELNNYYRQINNQEAPTYLRGFGDRKTVYALSYNNRNESEKHMNDNLESFVKMYVHECAHLLHHYSYGFGNHYLINEGFASYISNQYEDSKLLEIPEYNDIKSNDYVLFKKFFSYLVDNYSKNIIISLLKGEIEVKDYYNQFRSDKLKLK